MGVRINGVWHEELADPGTGGSDEGGGRNFDSPQQYNQASAQLSANNAWGENLNTWAGTGGQTSNQAALGALGGAAGGSAQQLGGAIDKLLQAIADGNKAAFDQAVKEFDLTFGLDKDKFAEAIRQYNQSYLITEAGLTGTYQGQATQQAIAQREAIAQAQAGLTGVYQGQQTQAAQQQAFAQQQALAQMYGQSYGGFGQVPTGQQTLAAQQQQYAQQMGVVNAAAALQANPFRQAQVLGQAQRILGGQGVAGFQAPNVVGGVGTAGGNTQGGLGYLQQMIDDIRNPAANTTSMSQFLAQTPTPNKVNSVDFLRSAPSTQNLVLQAMQEKYGLDPKDALQQIQQTLPQFQAPTVVGTVKR